MKNPDTNTLVSSLLLIMEHLFENGDVVRASAINQAAQRLSAVDCALRDAISTYDSNNARTLVTAERQEAWIEALTK